MIKTENFEKVELSSGEELRAWLLENHQQEESIWLVTFKKHVTGKYLSTGEVLDELLCFGWIDGIRRKLDEDRTMQLIGPRRMQHWAKTYKDRAARLIEEDKMMPAGYKSIEVSKQNGMWNFMDDVDALIKPADLEKELDKHSSARKHFDAFPASVQRFTLRWIKLAKTESTRAKRIAKAAALAQTNKRIPGV